MVPGQGTEVPARTARVHSEAPSARRGAASSGARAPGPARPPLFPHPQLERGGVVAPACAWSARFWLQQAGDRRKYEPNHGGRQNRPPGCEVLGKLLIRGRAGGTGGDPDCWRKLPTAGPGSRFQLGFLAPQSPPGGGRGDGGLRVGGSDRLRGAMRRPG